MSWKTEPIDIPFQTLEAVSESGSTPLRGDAAGPTGTESNDATPSLTKSRFRKRRRGRKRIGIGDALRQEGLDEREVARRLANMVTRHTPDEHQPSRGGTDKMLVDLLKECLRHLDDGADSKETLSLKLIHRVPRPRRSDEIENK